MALSKKHVYAYVAWLLLFCAIELPAVFNTEPGDTFSEMIWAFMDWHIVPALAVSGFTVWLAHHFLGRWFT